MGEGREDASKWWHLACLWARKPVSIHQLPALWVELCSWGFRGTGPYPENALRQGRKGVAPKPAVSHSLPSPSPWSQGLALLTLVPGPRSGGRGERLQSWDKVRDRAVRPCVKKSTN